MFRTSWVEMAAVAAVSLALTIAGSGVIDGKLARQFSSLGRDIGGLVSGLHRTLVGVVPATEPVVIAGPVCALVEAEGGVLAIDREGSIASFDSATSRSDLPVFTGFTPGSRRAGEVLSSGEMIVGMAVLTAFESSPEMMKGLSEINLHSLDDPRAVLTGGVIVNLGTGGYKLKVQELGRVLAELKRLNHKPRAIDMRFARQAVVKCDEPEGKIEKAETGDKTVAAIEAGKPAVSAKGEKIAKATETAKTAGPGKATKAAEVKKTTKSVKKASAAKPKSTTKTTKPTKTGKTRKKEV